MGGSDLGEGAEFFFNELFFIRIRRLDMGISVRRDSCSCLSRDNDARLPRDFRFGCDVLWWE